LHVLRHLDKALFPLDDAANTALHPVGFTLVRLVKRVKLVRCQFGNHFSRLRIKPDGAGELFNDVETHPVCLAVGTKIGGCHLITSFAMEPIASQPYHRYSFPSGNRYT
jgi:hypothetical protein